MNWNQPETVVRISRIILVLVLVGHNAYMHIEQWVHFDDDEHADRYK